MDIQTISRYKSSFDQIVNHIDNEEGGEQIEVWFARDLQLVLGYARWENFVVAIKRAVESCKSQNINIDDHFRETTKMVPFKEIVYGKIINNVSGINMTR